MKHIPQYQQKKENLYISLWGVNDELEEKNSKIKLKVRLKKEKKKYIKNKYNIKNI